MTKVSDRSVILVGGHDTGKSNYLGRLWIALRKRDGALSVHEDPDDIEYVESLIQAIHSGEYVGRTSRDEQPRFFDGTAKIEDGPDGRSEIKIFVPDVNGELWEKASEQRELPNEWLERIQKATGALLFLRIGSKHHVEGIDWITSPALMQQPLAQHIPQGAMPTQLFLTDMVKVLERNLGKNNDTGSPRLAIVIAAWDLLPDQEQARPPDEFVAENYPLLHGRLRDCRIETQTFGVSITGGDLRTEEHRTAFLDSNAEDEGFVVFAGETGALQKTHDLTIPVAWAVGAAPPVK